MKRLPLSPTYSNAKNLWQPAWPSLFFLECPIHKRILLCRLQSSGSLFVVICKRTRGLELFFFQLVPSLKKREPVMKAGEGQTDALLLSTLFSFWSSSQVNLHPYSTQDWALCFEPPHDCGRKESIGWFKSFPVSSVPQRMPRSPSAPPAEKVQFQPPLEFECFVSLCVSTSFQNSVSNQAKLLCRKGIKWRE